MTKRRRGLLRKLGESITLFLIPFFSYGLFWLYRLTLRVETVNAQAISAFFGGNDEEPVIMAFWHGRLLVVPYLARKRRIAIMISRHRDGELINRAVRFFSIDSVRGSTTRGGIQALRGLIRALKRGSHVAITPDGPRGPRNRAQMGVIMLAAATGRPILPVTYGVSKGKTFKSWDRFLLPYPFCRGVLVWGEPIWVDPEEGQAGFEEKRKILEARLNEMTLEADSYFDR
ncbi:MAG: lysophospholipid acyltransferase family protein [Deltaproteobacteria bacterium]|nr:lysophospholipid acyltransferase family protein [Deltaproteobacteria bacterium]MBW2120976.1 lysophospholipid acyltransferase family protein [Deltaproteobacteria bacterium]